MAWFHLLVNTAITQRYKHIFTVFLELAPSDFHDK